MSLCHPIDFIRSSFSPYYCRSFDPKWATASTDKLNGSSLKSISVFEMFIFAPAIVTIDFAPGFFRSDWLADWILISIQFSETLTIIGISDWLPDLQIQFNFNSTLISPGFFRTGSAALTIQHWRFRLAICDCGWRLWRQWIVTLSFHHQNSNCRSPLTWRHFKRMDQLPFWTMSWQPYGFTILTLSARWTNIYIPWKWPAILPSHRQCKTGPIIGQPGTQIWAVQVDTTSSPPMPLSIGSCWTLLRPQTLWSTSATHSAHLAIVTTVSWHLVTCRVPSSSTSSAVTWQTWEQCAGTWIVSATTFNDWINAWQIWWSRWRITCQIWPQTLAWVTTEAWPDRWKWALPQLSSDKLPSSHRHSQFVFIIFCQVAHQSDYNHRFEWINQRRRHHAWSLPSISFQCLAWRLFGPRFNLTWSGWSRSGWWRPCHRLTESQTTVLTAFS